MGMIGLDLAMVAQ